MIHTIESGESLHKIAKRYGVSLESIVGANPFLKHCLPCAGQAISIPSGSYIIECPGPESLQNAMAREFPYQTWATGLNFWRIGMGEDGPEPIICEYCGCEWKPNRYHPDCCDQCGGPR